MKRGFLLPFTLSLVAVCSLAAVTQTGYVKTRGRVNEKGQYIKGNRLPSATVVLQNGSSVTANGSGNFTLQLPSNTFYLKNVKKVGYIVADPDALSKQYTCSPNPLILTLDKLENQQNDELATEKRLRQKTEKELAKRKKEIDLLKKENKITQAKYDEALQKINADRESTERFIMEMAERYSKIDFDQLDDYQRQIAAFIQNCELIKADSLLRTKGSMTEREAEIDRIIKANKEEEFKIAERIKNLNDSKKVADMLIADYNIDCYHHYQLCKLRFDNDSAAFWLKQRAARNPENLDYKLEAGVFIRDYLADYPLAHKYFKEILDSAVKKYGADNDYLVKVYSNIGETYSKQADYFQASQNYLNAKHIINKNHGMDDIKLFPIYCDLGNVNYMAGDYAVAEMFYNQACDLKLMGDTIEDDSDMANLYNRIGLWDIDMNNLDDALESLNKSLKIRLAILGDNHYETASSYNNIGNVYAEQEKFSEALDFYKKALNIRLEIFGENHPDVAQSYSNIGEAYFCLSDFEHAVENQEKALNIRLNIFGENQLVVADSYDNLAKTYRCLHKPEKERTYKNKAYKIRYELQKKTGNLINDNKRRSN